MRSEMTYLFLVELCCFSAQYLEESGDFALTFVIVFFLFFFCFISVLSRHRFCASLPHARF